MIINTNKMLKFNMFEFIFYNRDLFLELTKKIFAFYDKLPTDF